MVVMTQSVSWLPPVLRRPAFWLIATVAALATLVLVGFPTVLIPNALFTRMTPTRPLDYVFWVVTAVLAGLAIATSSARATGVAPVCPPDAGGSRITAGGLLTLFAVGCPTCNKLVLLVLGATGAMTYFAPLQPLLGAASVALLVATLRTRLNALRLAYRAPLGAAGSAPLAHPSPAV